MDVEDTVLVAASGSLPPALTDLSFEERKTVIWNHPSFSGSLMWIAQRGRCPHGLAGEQRANSA